MIILDPLQWPLCALKEEDNWKVMMFTGLLDRFGKEIYEGDIVKNNDLVWLISWSNVGCYIMALKDEVKGNENLFIDEAQYSEVIGNIYSNPELLK